MFFICVKFDQMSSSGLGGVALTIYDWHSEWITIPPPTKTNPCLWGRILDQSINDDNFLFI
jgi:hypothetical protein